jgi:hypothetical protein
VAGLAHSALPSYLATAALASPRATFTAGATLRPGPGPVTKAITLDFSSARSVVVDMPGAVAVAADVVTSRSITISS